MTAIDDAQSLSLPDERVDIAGEHRHRLAPAIYYGIIELAKVQGLLGRFAPATGFAT
jgi:hypothetical protein